MKIKFSSKHKSLPFGELHDKESLFSDKKSFSPAEVVWATTQTVLFITCEHFLAICRAIQLEKCVFWP